MYTVTHSVINKCLPTNKYSYGMDLVLIVWREILHNVLSFKTILDVKKFVLNGYAMHTIQTGYMPFF
jgi:hypothetical protein